MSRMTQSEINISIIYCTVTVLVNLFIIYMMAVLSFEAGTTMVIHWALLPAMGTMLGLVGICVNESVILNRVFRLFSFILTYWAIAQLATTI